MFLVKHFQYGLVVKVVFLSGKINQIVLFDNSNGYPKEFFSLGYIMSEKTNLCTGWVGQKDLKTQAEAARMLTEAFDIFEDDFTQNELLKIGYKNTNTIQKGE